jgi:c-di-GMP-binding flagellar brake protein YcgR
MANRLANEEETPAMTATAAALDSPEFLVRTREDVIRLCNGIREQGIPLSISFSCDDSVAPSSLIFVDPQSNMLLLEYSPQWQRIQGTMDMHHDIYHGNIDYTTMLQCVYEDSKLQFQCGKSTIVDLNGTPVAGLDIPGFMWRFQRRRNRRYKVPGLKVTLNLGFLEAEAEVADLAMGGMGVVVCDPAVRLEVGEVLHACTVCVPGAGQILADLTVRHQSRDQIIDSREVIFVGCEFTGLSVSARQLIAQYVGSLADT